MSNIYCVKLDCPCKKCTVHDVNSRNVRNARYRDYEGNKDVCIKAQIFFDGKPTEKKASKQLPVPTEDEEQEALFQWAERLCFKYPELGLLHHIPNEGKRSKATGARLKKEGMKSGVPDIHLPVARGEFHSLYIELKRRKGSSTTDAQNTWLQMLGKYGNKAVRCYGWEEAAKVIVEYLEEKE